MEEIKIVSAEEYRLAQQAVVTLPSGTKFRIRKTSTLKSKIAGAAGTRDREVLQRLMNPSTGK